MLAVSIHHEVIVAKTNVVVVVASECLKFWDIWT